MELLIALTIGGYLGWTFNEPDKFDCKDDAMIVLSCPELTVQDDPSFGGTILKLQDVAGQYRECRQACLKPSVQE